jgi:hypothetical protein
MRFNFGLILSSLALALAQDASGPNAFNVPTTGYLLHAGQPTTFTWGNIKGDTVTLSLRDGPNGDLNKGTTIICK